MSGILCYTTTIDPSKSVSEICGMLAQSNAVAILQEYDGAQNVIAISFRKKTNFGEMSFRLPIDVQAVHQLLKNQWQQRKIPRSLANDSFQARRVAWRIVRNWIEAQLALIDIGMVKVEQVFLPYAQNAQGQTVFEAMTEQHFAGLALPAPQAA